MRGGVLVVLGGVVVVLGALTHVAHADSALDKPAFTATPSELLAAAKKQPAGAADVFVLREDKDISFDDRGRITTHWRMVFVVLSRAGADDWGQLGTTWQPSYQDKPKLRARVIDPSGAVADLDASRITDAPEWTTTVIPDVRHRIESPLPRLQVGSVVEEQLDWTDREPLLGGSATETYVFTHSVPVVSARLTISAPAKRKLHVVAKAVSVKPKAESRDGRQRLTYIAGPLAALDEHEGSLPPDAAYGGFVAVSIADSWRSVAHDYRTLIDKRIAEGAVAFPADVPKTATQETVGALVGWLHKNVRNDDVPFNAASMIPATPAETLKRGAGDAKDKATLLVSLLRQAGITAELALFNSGPGIDIDHEMVALDAFDDVMVRARLGGKDLWIDPTSSASRPGQLPGSDRNRLTLVIADSTTALVSSPAEVASDNTSRELRTYEVAEQGAAKITELSRTTGSLEVTERAWFRDASPDNVRKNLGDYVDDRYQGATLDTYSMSDVFDFSKPFELTVKASGSGRAFSKRMRADVYLFPTDVLSHLPDEL
ncbi:MAG TPA: DUF3857 domain-containing transglutaminase family protein, partial [Kofleriaceae bacterium]|nr:DUF3857 domain-containing transglutaminase family protein [Kofleriaceae bacterium]